MVKPNALPSWPRESWKCSHKVSGEIGDDSINSGGKAGYPFNPDRLSGVNVSCQIYTSWLLIRSDGLCKLQEIAKFIRMVENTVSGCCRSSSRMPSYNVGQPTLRNPNAPASSVPYIVGSTGPSSQITNLIEFAEYTQRRENWQ